MSISEPFIRRPVATSLLMVGVILLGTLGYKLLPISALPTVDFPTIEVTTYYPGASADVMVSAITTPLERQFGQIAGLASMNSTSSFGVCVRTPRRHTWPRRDEYQQHTLSGCAPSANQHTKSVRVRSRPPTSHRPRPP